MSEDKVHVNSYTRSDGTEVAEYERNYPNGGSSNDGGYSETNSQPKDDMYLPEIYVEDPAYNTVLYGHIETQSDVEPETSTSTNDIVIDDSNFELEPIISETSSIIDEIRKEVEKEVRNRAPNGVNSIIKSIDKLVAVYNKSVDYTEKLLDKMINTSNQSEYKKLYNKYSRQKQFNDKNEYAIKKIKYSAQNKNYEILVDELNKYKSDFKKVVAQNSEQRPLVRVKSSIDSLNSDKINSLVYQFSRNNPDIAKAMIDGGMFTYNIKYNMPDAKEMWKASSFDFKHSKKYIQKNGGIMYNIDEIPHGELRDIVKNKVKGQLEKQNSVGIIYNSKSRLSRQLGQSPELKNYFMKNKDKIINGQVVKGGSAYFNSNQNLSKALGHADIVYMFVDNNSDLNAVVLDTYDFNKNDTDWKVIMARGTQDAGIIRNYYSINVVKVPKKTWNSWL